MLLIDAYTNSTGMLSTFDVFEDTLSVLGFDVADVSIWLL